LSLLLDCGVLSHNQLDRKVAVVRRRVDIGTILDQEGDGLNVCFVTVQAVAERCATLSTAPMNVGSILDEHLYASGAVLFVSQGVLE
jgi:hypothetical protein